MDQSLYQLDPLVPSRRVSSYPFSSESSYPAPQTAYSAPSSGYGASSAYTSPYAPPTSYDPSQTAHPPLSGYGASSAYTSPYAPPTSYGPSQTAYRPLLSSGTSAANADPYPRTTSPGFPDRNTSKPSKRDIDEGWKVPAGKNCRERVWYVPRDCVNVRDHEWSRNTANVRFPKKRNRVRITDPILA